MCVDDTGTVKSQQQLPEPCGIQVSKKLSAFGNTDRVCANYSAVFCALLPQDSKTQMGAI